MQNKEPTRKQLIEAQKRVKVYEGIYTINCEREVYDENAHDPNTGNNTHVIKGYDKKVRCIFDARNDVEALDRALNHYSRAIIPFLLAPHCKTATLEYLSEKRFIPVPGKEPYVWVAEDFGLKELENKVVARA